MSSTQLRPRFHLEVDMPLETAYAQLTTILQEPGCPYEGKLLTHQIEIHIPEPNHHFWSPYLNLVLRPRENAPGAMLDGRFGPSTEVWTMFMAFYAALIFSGLGLLVLGFSQWSVDVDPWGIWGSLACLVGLGLVHWIAHTGRKLGNPQSREIHDFVHKALNEVPPPCC